jgi:Methyltransferase domain/C-methyltransferase C-terminal domain
VSCRLCGGNPISFWKVHSVPTNSCVLFESEDAARRQLTGDIDLAVCPVCGFIQNSEFDPSAVDYLAPYEESQASSPTFRRFAEETIDTLLDRYALAGGTVLEIGCGKAEWLAAMCKAGDMSGIGIDPAYVPGRVPLEDERRYEVITEYFGAGSTLTGNLVACRHTLEHVPSVSEFTGWLAEAASRTPGAIVFIEVPDTARILEEGAFWDVYYEHCAYFTARSLRNLTAVVGLTVADLRSGFGDQYLLLESTPGGERRPFQDPEGTVDKAIGFAERAETAIEDWRKRMQGADRVALWGATSKTVSFISATMAEPIAVADINPAKQATYLPGSGAPIVSPEVLASYDPELVIAMNPIYLDEIGAELGRLGILAELVALGEPDSC